MNIFLKNENRKPLEIGLTGGIGSGKSTVAKVFEKLGFPVFNSDIEAKLIINNDKNVVDQVIAEFGDVYTSGKLDVLKLGDIVFKDKQALEKLNKIVHPKVKENYTSWVKMHADSLIVIKEAAILIESGAHEQMDKIILVKAPEELKLQRVAARDKVSEDKVKQRIEVQLSDEEKSAYADFIIINDEKELVVRQVVEILNQIKKP